MTHLDIAFLHPQVGRTYLGRLPRLRHERVLQSHLVSCDGRELAVPWSEVLRHGFFRSRTSPVLLPGRWSENYGRRDTVVEAFSRI